MRARAALATFAFSLALVLGVAWLAERGAAPPSASTLALVDATGLFEHMAVRQNRPGAHQETGPHVPAGNPDRADPPFDLRQPPRVEPLERPRLPQGRGLQFCPVLVVAHATVAEVGS